MILGFPPQTAQVGLTYSFRPEAAAVEGDTLTFAASNLPRWAQFDPASGQLMGIPTLADIGRYERIRISVSDGTYSQSLSAFDIEVLEFGNLAVTLVWQPPEQNEDGTPLSDLAGYVIRHGPQWGSYPFRIEINNPGITTYVITELIPGEHYFTVVAFNGAGIESQLSNSAGIEL